LQKSDVDIGLLTSANGVGRVLKPPRILARGQTRESETTAAVAMILPCPVTTAAESVGGWIRSRALRITNRPDYLVRGS